MKTIIINEWLKFTYREDRSVKFEPAYRNGAYINVFIHSDECEKFLKENDINYQISNKNNIDK